MRWKAQAGEIKNAARSGYTSPPPSAEGLLLTDSKRRLQQLLATILHVLCGPAMWGTAKQTKATESSIAFRCLRFIRKTAYGMGRAGGRALLLGKILSHRLLRGAEKFSAQQTGGNDGRRCRKHNGEPLHAATFLSSQHPVTGCRAGQITLYREKPRTARKITPTADNDARLALSAPAAAVDSAW